MESDFKFDVGDRVFIIKKINFIMENREYHGVVVNRLADVLTGYRYYKVKFGVGEEVRTCREEQLYPYELSEEFLYDMFSGENYE